ncbi:MAG: hypothetical protein V4642_05510 [Bacteroidota bacterium]
MRFKNYLLTFFIIGVLAGCKSSTTEPDTTPKTIMPLKTGNSWVYKSYTIEPNTGLKIDTKRDFTTTVGAETLVNGEKWFSISNFIMPNNDEVMVQLKADGLWLTVDDLPGLLFKYPAQLNSTFTNPGGMVTVVSTSAKVESGGKNYTCYHYKIQEEVADSDINFYVAPGIGLVKYTSVVGELGAFYTTSQELQSYSLK